MSGEHRSASCNKKTLSRNLEELQELNVFWLEEGVWG